MANLILKTRLDMLRKNLGEVRDVLESIEKGRQALRTLVELAGEKAVIQEKLTNIRQRNLRLRASLLDQLQESIADEVEQQMSEIDRDVLEIKVQLKEVADTAAQLTSRALPIPKELVQTLKEQLIREAEEQIAGIRDLSRRVDEASLAQAQGGGSPEAGRATWMAAPGSNLSSYMSIRDESRTVFGEYVDFLGGLALRDTGFDDGICRIADEFFTAEGRFGDVQWSSLTIPAREGVRGATMARIIRLGFPEWTIWALPLAAHEFGHVVIETVKGIEGFVQQKAGDERSKAQLRICLADAFATYFMGPAYAWAAILMRFDPLAAFDDDDAGLTQKRVETVLAMLRRMDRPAGSAAVGSRYGRIADRLAVDWNAALLQAGVPAPEEPKNKPEIDSLIDCLVESIPIGRDLPKTAWPKIEAWATRLWDEERDPEQVDVGVSDDIRYVLNAAWLCRARIYDDEDSSTDATAAEFDGFEKMERIAKAARELWEQVDEKRRREPHSTSRLPAPQGAGREPEKSSSSPSGQGVRT